MEIGSLLLKEIVLLNYRVQLIVLGDSDVVNQAFKLGVDEEQEAGVKSWILEYSGAIIELNLSIVVDIGHSSSNGKVLCNCAVRQFDHAWVLHIESAALISIILNEGAILERGLNRLIIGKHDWSTTDWEILQKETIFHIHNWIGRQLDKCICTPIILIKGGVKHWEF